MSALLSIELLSDPCDLVLSLEQLAPQIFNQVPSFTEILVRLRLHGAGLLQRLLHHAYLSFHLKYLLFQLSILLTL
jgi:hypothetical protein